MPNDEELLRVYVERKSEEAFAELVRRKLPIVLSAALRRTNGDAMAAEDIAQQVFVLLAQKADSLQGHPVVSGWLFTTTHHLAAKAALRKQRREKREALMTPEFDENETEIAWDELRPVIDDAMLSLSEDDRRAVLLRFFENRSFGEIGAVLRLPENTARMRVNRALESLRSTLARNGITSSSAALGLALSGHAACAVQPLLVSTIAHTAIGGTSGAGFLLTMSTTSLKFSATVVVAVGAIAYGVFEHVRYAEARDEIAEARRENVRLRGAQTQSRTTTPPIAAANLLPQANALPTTKAETHQAATDDHDPATSTAARTLHLAKQAAQLTVNVKPFFRRIGLSEEQWTRYVKTLLSGMEVELDASALAREKGLSNKQQEAVMADQMAQVRRDLVDAIGPAANMQLIEFNRRMSARQPIEELAGKLMFTGEMLTAQQGEAAVEVLAKYRTQIRRTGTGSFIVPAEALEELKAVLSAQQLEIFTQQQMAHRAEPELTALKRLSK